MFDIRNLFLSENNREKNKRQHFGNVHKQQQRQESEAKFLHYTKLRTNCYCKNRNLKWTIKLEAVDSSMAPNAARKTSCKARNTGDYFYKVHPIYELNFNKNEFEPYVLRIFIASESDIYWILIVATLKCTHRVLTMERLFLQMLVPRWSIGTSFAQLFGGYVSSERC